MAGEDDDSKDVRRVAQHAPPQQHLHAHATASVSPGHSCSLSCCGCAFADSIAGQVRLQRQRVSSLAWFVDSAIFCCASSRLPVNVYSELLGCSLSTAAPDDKPWSFSGV